MEKTRDMTTALQMQVAAKASDKASRTKLYNRSDQFNPQWSDIAGFCLTLEKLLPYHPAEITG
jgi:hypothetical protein